MKEARKNQITKGHISGLLTGSGSFFSAICFALVLWHGFKLTAVDKNVGIAECTIGTLTLVLQNILTIIASITAILSFYGYGIQACVSSTEIFKIIDRVKASYSIEEHKN